MGTDERREWPVPPAGPPAEVTLAELLRAARAARAVSTPPAPAAPAEHEARDRAA